MNLAQVLKPTAVPAKNPERLRENLCDYMNFCILRSDMTRFSEIVKALKVLGQDYIAEAKQSIVANSQWRKSRIAKEVSEFLVSKDYAPETNQYYIHNALKNCPLTDSFRPASLLASALAKATDPNKKEQLDVIKYLLKSTPENQFVAMSASLKLGLISEIQAAEICFNNQESPFGRKTGSHHRLKAYLIGYLAQSQYVDKADPSDFAKVIKIISAFLKRTTSAEVVEAFVPETDIAMNTAGLFTRASSLLKGLPSFDKFCTSVDLRQIGEAVRVLNNLAEESEIKYQLEKSLLSALYMLAKNNQTFQDLIEDFKMRSAC